jgi:hypothetical protein
LLPKIAIFSNILPRPSSSRGQFMRGQNNQNNMADKKSTKQDELTSSRTEKTESPADFLGSCFE